VPKQNKVNVVVSTITGIETPENEWLIRIYWEFTGNLPVNFPRIPGLKIFPGISR